MPAPAQVEIEQQLSPILRRHVDGHMEMCCPRCESWFEVAFGFKFLERVSKFRKYINPVARCLHCKHTFSPKWLAQEDDE